MDSKSVGRRIASARLGAGFRSSAAFGAAIGKSEYTVRSYETGRINPPMAVLREPNCHRSKLNYPVIPES